MKIKVYQNIIYFSNFMYFESEQEFTETIKYLLNVVDSHKTMICDFNTNILYKNKLKDQWYCSGSICFGEKEMTMSDGFYLKKDLENISSFKNKMIEIETNIPNVKDFLSPKQTFCYPNSEEKKIDVGIKLW
jgi:hypothetical protein